MPPIRTHSSKFAGFLFLAAVLMSTGCEDSTASQKIKDEPTAPAPAVAEKLPQPASQDPKSLRIYQTSELAKTKLKVKGKQIPVWIADNDTKRQEGMMWLRDKDVPEGHGMIFVFPDEQPRSFWMENTLIGLDIVYIDAKGKVVRILQGKPKDKTNLPSGKPAKYVLELELGQARKYRIYQGSVIEIPKDLKSKD